MTTGTAVARPAATRAAAVRQMWGAWLASRALTLLLLVPEHKVLGDVQHYYTALDGVARGGPVGAALPEYPAPVLGFLALPRLLSGQSVPAYQAGFVLLVLAVDAALARALFRAAGRWLPGVTLWVAALPLLGPMILCRFDLLPAALAGGALLAVATRPGLAGTLAGLGAAVKLWPAALVPALWLHRDGRWRMLGAFAAVLLAAAGLVAAVAGVDRLVSPLSWQGERGLQLEAYAALPLLVAGMVRPGVWHVQYTRFYAFQVVGPGTGTALAAAVAASGLAALLLAALWLRAARLRDALPPGVPGLLAVLAVCLFAITDKTLSPQYLIWVAALLAALGVTHPAAVPRAATGLLLATCAVTQVIFPLNYDPLVAIEPYAVLLLLARDAGLLAVAWLVGRQAWALTRRAAR